MFGQPFGIFHSIVLRDVDHRSATSTPTLITRQLTLCRCCKLIVLTKSHFISANGETDSYGVNWNRVFLRLRPEHHPSQTSLREPRPSQDHYLRSLAAGHETCQRTPALYRRPPRDLLLENSDAKTRSIIALFVSLPRVLQDKRPDVVELEFLISQIDH